MFKRLLRSRAMQIALGRVLGWYMLFAAWTTKWEYVDRHYAEEIWAKGGPAVACFWHSRTILSHVGWNIRPWRKLKQPGKVMISNSPEGGIVAAATFTVGADVVRGSSAKGSKSKGALEAMRQFLRHMQAGGCAIMTPDGPRGPRMRAQMGPVQLAKHTGAPMIGYCWAVEGQRVMNSWDRFAVPGPFKRGVYVWSKPIYVARDASAADMETARLAFEAEMIRICHEAERRAGVPLTEPEAVAAPAPPAASAA
jgi:lysophospholipid acyltransferase (LPLAT)-like uncharacterized protein